MKKTIKPSPVMLLIYAIITGALAFIVIIDIDGGEGYAMVLPCIASGVMFIFYLLGAAIAIILSFTSPSKTLHPASIASKGAWAKHLP